MSAPLFEPVKFLLVDDLEENLLSLDGLLRREGLILLKAKSGPEALELLLQHDVALALLDVQMPGMDGFELAELMRGTERTRRIPIIFLTAGHNDRQRRFRGYETGAVDFLHKPIEPDILRSKASVFYELYRQQQQIAIQRDTLQAQAEALKEADKRKDEFLATLAHELRNPLAPIRNGLQVLSMNPKEDVSANIKEIMDRQLSHLVRLIEDLMDISRVSQGKIELRKERLKLQTALQAAVEASQALIDAGKHSLILDIPEDALWLDADLTRIAQMVSNLLNNAAKYTPSGGKIQLSVHKEDNQAIICVIDNGLGIPKDMLEKVFEMFAQVNNTLDRSQGGLGIGLALVSRLVEMHGGSIRAESNGLGQGSSFTIRLPLAGTNEENTATQSDTVQNTGNANPLTVLVVDDNKPSAQTMGWMLEIMGHDLHIAYTGKDAIELAHEVKPDVILLDIGLPDISGYEVCRTLRTVPQFQDTVLIAQTGWGQDRDRMAAKDAGFNHHLVKPVNFEKFSQLLNGIQRPH